jgi:hypothetical protein
MPSLPLKATATVRMMMMRTRGQCSGCGQDQKEEEMEGRKDRIDWRDQSHCEIDSKDDHTLPASGQEEEDDDEEEKPSARARTT